MTRKICKDHRGITFNSETELCKAYGVKPHTFRARIKKGWSLEDALTKGIDYSNPASVCRDHLGNEYRSKAEMCKIYGTTLKTFNKHISEGWTLEEALMHIPKNSGISCEDHLGNTYSSIKKMCEAYGIKHSSFIARIKYGWSLEEALTVKPNKARHKCKSCRDHLGIEYSSISEMCKFYGIEYNVFRARIKSGWSLARALMTGSELGNLSEDK